MLFNYQFKNSYGNERVKYHYNDEKVKLLGIYIDNTLNFDYHIVTLRKGWEKIACSNSSFQIHEHFPAQINCKCFYNVSVLLLSFSFNVS